MLSPEDCTSLIEAFTEEQILGHVKSLDTGLHVSQDRLQVSGNRTEKTNPKRDGA